MRGYRGRHRVVDPDNSASASFRGRAHPLPGCGPASAPQVRKCVAIGVRTPVLDPDNSANASFRGEHTHTLAVVSPHLSRNCTRIARSGAVPGQVLGNRTPPLVATLELGIPYGGRVTVTRT